MGLISTLFGTPSIAQPIEAIGNVLDKLFTSDDERLTKEILLTRLAMSPQLAQLEIAKIEAQHKSIFVSGARPFIIWCCGLGLLFAFIINPLIQWVTGHPGPNLPLDNIYNLLIGILGLGAYRTVEKIHGKAR